MLKGEVYHKRFHYFNKKELNDLLAYQMLCKEPESFLEMLAERTEKLQRDKIFPDTPPAYHSKLDCEWANRGYVNYPVPEEIKERGEDAERAFLSWFSERLNENSRYRWDELLQDSLLTRCQLEFKLSSKPKKFDRPNSGTRTLSIQEVETLEQIIDNLIADAYDFSNQSNDHRRIISALGTHAYKGKMMNEEIKNPSLLEDSEVRLILRTFESSFKRPIIANLETYYRSKYNSSLAFDGNLLAMFGFQPCRGCIKPT